MNDQPKSETPPPFPTELEATTTGVGQTIDDGKGRIFPCPGCGSDFIFHIGQQNLECPHCGLDKEIEIDEDAAIEEQDLLAMFKVLREHHEHDRHDEVGQNEVRCDKCGATVVFTGSLTSSECPYCTSPIQRGDVYQAEHRIPVDAVLPFQIERKKAKANLANWVSSRWFAPNEFLKRGAEGKFSGVYIPYWTFDAATFTRYEGERGEHYYVTVGTGKNKHQVRRTNWYPASGAFQRFFDDVLVIGAKDLPKGLIRGLEPWPLGKCLPFNQQVLAGFFARTYDVDLPEGYNKGEQRITEALQADVRNRIGGDEQRIHDIKTRKDALTFKHVLLPLWLLAYRYRDKVYQVVVNAGTGEVQGDRPYSWVKIGLAVLAAASVVIGFMILRNA